MIKTIKKAAAHFLIVLMTIATIGSGLTAVGIAGPDTAYANGTYDPQYTLRWGEDSIVDAMYVAGADKDGYGNSHIWFGYENTQNDGFSYEGFPWWRVLDKTKANDEKTEHAMFLLSEDIWSSYYNAVAKSHNNPTEAKQDANLIWKSSPARSWCEGLYNGLFTANEKTAIKTVTKKEDGDDWFHNVWHWITENGVMDGYLGCKFYGKTFADLDENDHLFYLSFKEVVTYLNNVWPRNTDGEIYLYDVDDRVNNIRTRPDYKATLWIEWWQLFRFRSNL